MARTLFEEVLGQGKLKGIPTSMPPTLWPIALSAISLWRKIWRRHREERTAIANMQFGVNHIVAEGDLVVVHWTLWGTNTQPGMGLPATGKPIKVSGMTLFRFSKSRKNEETPITCFRCSSRQACSLPKDLRAKSRNFQPTIQPTHKLVELRLSVIASSADQ